MAAASRATGGTSWATHCLVQRLVYEAARAIALRALARYRFSNADQEDVVHDVLVRLWSKREQYRAELGSPEQWITGATHRAAIDFIRARASASGAIQRAVALDASIEPPSPAETVMWSQLAEFANDLLEVLPEDLRRVVILREIELHSFAEIAEIEGISPATAHARHAKGMEMLQRARDERKLGAWVVPAVPGDAGAVDEPSAEALERGWARFVADVGLDLPPDSEPPPSGRRRTARSRQGDRPPSSYPPAGRLSRLRKLGPLMAIFLGPGVADAGRSEPAADPAPAPLVVAAEVPALNAPVAPVTRDVVLAASSTPGSASSAPGVRIAVPATLRHGPTPSDNDAERALMERARAALLSRNWQGVVKALTDHARQFPAGQFVAERRQAWVRACKAYRDAHPQDGSPELDKSCTAN